MAAATVGCAVLVTPFRTCLGLKRSSVYVMCRAAAARCSGWAATPAAVDTKGALRHAVAARGGGCGSCGRLGLSAPGANRGAGHEHASEQHRGAGAVAPLSG